MKTKTIFKTLAAAMLMPAMLLTTACSSDDGTIVNNPENTAGKGYALPVTINVTRQGDEATRATYNETDKILEFSTGDQLFVQGTDADAGQFAGTLEWQSGGTFSGTIYTASSYSGTADALLTSATSATATLLPNDYEDYGFLSVSGDGYDATLSTVAANAFATSKAAAVEQLSLEQATTYDEGFELAPQNAIINFTAVTGEYGKAPASSSVSLQVGETAISGSVEPVESYARALANFAMAVAGSESPSNYTLTVDGTSVSLGSKTLVAGKIYNQKCANINAVSPMIQANEKWLVYGTGEPSGWRLTIAEGATVTLSNVYLGESAIISYRGNNTIILADGTTNRVEPNSDVAINGMMAYSGDGSLTIKGNGTLIAKGGGPGHPAIGVGWGSTCGDITIAETVTLTATASEGCANAITTNGGGTVTIGGTVYPDGTGTPFVYPIPAPAARPLAEATADDLGKIAGADGRIYDTQAAATAANTTAVAMIAYVGNGTDHTTYTHGLAIALEDEASTMDWSTAKSTCEGKTAVTNAAWVLPSQNQWKAMFSTNGGSDSSYSGLNTAITTAEGTALQEYVPDVYELPYWSSTEEDESYSYYVILYDGEVMILEVGKNELYLARAVLAF